VTGPKRLKAHCKPHLVVTSCMYLNLTQRENLATNNGSYMGSANQV